MLRLRTSSFPKSYVGAKLRMANGYVPIRLHSPWSRADLKQEHKGKKPLVWNWSRGDSGVLQLPVLETCSTGMLTAGLRAIDVDVDDPAKVEGILKAAHKLRDWKRSMIRRRRNSPRVAIVFRAAEGSPAKVIKTNPATGEKVEVLGNGQQLVIDGYHQSSLRGELIPLEWDNNRAPWNWPVAELGTASEDEITAFLEEAGGILGIAPIGRGITSAGNTQALPIPAAPLRLVTLPGDGPAQRPAHAPARVATVLQPFGLTNELSNGIEGWFDQLIEPVQREVVLHGLDKLDVAGVNRTRAAGGGRDAWIKIGMALAHSGLSDAEDVWIEWSRRAPDADDEGELTRQFHSFRKNKGTTRPITIGTLLKLATDHGARFLILQGTSRRCRPSAGQRHWASPRGRKRRYGPTLRPAFKQIAPSIDDQQPGIARRVIRGGTLNEQTALSLMNALFFVAERDGETGIFRVEDDGALTAFKAESFALKHKNTFVRVEGTKARNPFR